MMTTTRPNVRKAQWYTLPQTAELLGVHRNSIHNYIRKKLLEGARCKLNGRMLFKGKAILAFWEVSMALLPEEGGEA